MPIEELKNLLADVADDVKQVHIHKRAVAQSRRIATRRAITAGVAALVLTAVPIATVAIMSGDEAPAADQGTVPTGDELIDGTFYEGVTTSPESGLATWRTGDERPEEVYLEGTPMVSRTGAISPDGRYLSYLTAAPQPGSGGGKNGRIMMYDMITDRETDLGAWSGEPADVCSEPSWAPDGKSLLVDYGRDHGTKRYAFIDIDSQEPAFLPVQPPGCDAHVATDDGVDVVYSLAADTDSHQLELMRTNPDKTTTSLVGDLLGKAGKGLRELTALSSDGRFACLATGATSQTKENLDRIGSCDTIVDTDSGEIVDIPIDDGQTWQANAAVFAQPGRLLITCRDEEGTENWQLWTPDGVLLDERPVTALKDTDESVWLGFVPGSS